MESSRRWWTLARRTIAAHVIGASAAVAQTNERVYEALEFRAVTPGARAVAMGKAFVGIADDATAAASNPAGLSNLLDPEISGEWIGSNLRHERMYSVNPLTTRTFSQFIGFPSFASFVTPLPDKPALRNTTVGVFYNSLQRYAERFEIPHRSFVVQGRPVTEDGYFGHLDIDAHAVGVAVAYVLSRAVSLGGSVTLHRIRVDSNANSGAPASPRNGTVTRDSARRLGGQAGVLVKPTHWLSIGAAYNPGTTFALTTTITGRFAPENSPPLPPVPIESIRTDRIQSPVQTIDYRLPDRVTVGLAVRPTQALTLLMDAGLVKYSQRVTRNFLIVDFLNQQQSARLRASDYYLDDALEIHAGVEYRTLRGGRVYALRAGFYSDPEHQMHFDYERSTQSPQAFGQSVRFNSLDRGVALAVTGGGGIVLANWLQLDAAVSVGRSAREAVLSSVVRFRR